MRWVGVVIAVASGLTMPFPASVHAQDLADQSSVADPSDDAPDASEPGLIPGLDAEPSPTLPRGRAIAALERGPCLAILEDAGAQFDPIAPDEAGGVAIPIRLRGQLGGLRIESRGQTEVNEILDCRLAVAILAWAPTLRDYDVDALIHYSTYRPGARIGSGQQVSAHASGLAIDLAVLGFADGTELDVLEAWYPRERGATACDGDDDLRVMICSAIDLDLFQVVLTPHYDHAHENHVHLEVRPAVDWSYVR